MEIPIIQLLGANGEELALYTYDPQQHKEEEAANIIENVINKLVEEEDEEIGLHAQVDDHLKDNFNITRVFAGIANTDKL